MGSYQKSERRIKELMFQRDGTRRIPTVSLSWHKSFNKRSRLTRSRLKKPKKLLLSILPSTEKLSKNLKKLRIDPEWPREHYPLPVNPLDSCKNPEIYFHNYIPNVGTP